MRGDGQTQAGAAKVSGGGIVGLREGLEDERLFGFGNSDAGIANFKMQLHPTGSGILHSHAYGYFSANGELDRIPHQVYESLHQTYRIAHQTGGDVARHLPTEI